jgi:hypothetical protein
LGCDFADDPHSPYEFFRDDDSASAWATDGFSLHKLPTHCRRSPWKQNPVKHHRPADDAEELSPIFGDGLKDQAAAVWD